MTPKFIINLLTIFLSLLACLFLHGQTAIESGGHKDSCCDNPNNKTANLKPWFKKRASMGNEPIFSPNEWQKRFLPTYLTSGLKTTKAVGYDVKANSGADFSNCCVSIRVKQEVEARHKHPHRGYIVQGYTHSTGCLNPGELAVIHETIYTQFIITYYNDPIDGRTRINEFLTVTIQQKDQSRTCDLADFDFWLTN